MGRKKKEEVENKNVRIINGRKFEVVKKTVECLKPLRNEEGYYMLDVLNYLTKIVPQTDSSFKTILSLASYLAYNNGNPANDNQRDLIIHLVEYWIDKGVLDIERKDRN